uniref:G domain-containing protein n=1 Tax=Neogobius melanostomus TaxID=47308 RepID=A0A8C6UCB6_9GOBI
RRRRRKEEELTSAGHHALNHKSMRRCTVSEDQRQFPLGNFRKEVMEYKPDNEEVQHLRFLLYGWIGAGKSSFINSVATTLLGRMAIPAAVNTSDAYKTHKIKNKSYFPFVFNDIMGLEGDNNHGARTEDIKLAMKGHIKDGYKFNPISPISEKDPHYNPHPKLDDKVHVLVCLLDVSSPEIHPLVLKKMKEVREAARDLGIPQIAIATHADALCEEIEKNLLNVYKSKALKKKVEFSNGVGIPLQCIMAVMNYCNGKTKIDPNMDTLILTVLKHMIDFGNDFIEEITQT